MKFQEEHVALIEDEIKPLLHKHWLEVSHYPDIPLDPDFERYAVAQNAGQFVVYTARDEGRLVGYIAFALGYNAHYQTSFQAVQDVLFLDPEVRKGGFGARLIAFADSQLKVRGVDVVYQHVKVARDFGPLLERMGYEFIDKIYGRRLR